MSDTLMLRRWDFRLVPSERSLEAVGKSVDLHIIGRSMAFDLFPRTYRGKNRCVLRQKHALINSRERTRIWLHTRHQDEAIEPYRMRLSDFKRIVTNTIKMSKKGDYRIYGYFDYVVPPLEGFWWQDGVKEIDITDTRFHHEIYLSDARRVAPEKLKTVVRHPIKKR